MPSQNYIYPSIPTTESNVVIDLATLNYAPFTPSTTDIIGLKLTGLNQLGTPATTVRVKLICSVPGFLSGFIGFIQVILPPIATLNYRPSQYVIDATDNSLDSLDYQIYYSAFLNYNPITLEFTDEELINSYPQAFSIVPSRVAVLDLIVPEQWSTDIPVYPIK